MVIAAPAGESVSIQTRSLTRADRIAKTEVMRISCLHFSAVSGWSKFNRETAYSAV